MNTAEMEEIKDLVKKHHILFMEAMKTRFCTWLSRSKKVWLVKELLVNLNVLKLVLR